MLFGGAAGEVPDLMSPDNTSDGWLRKKWVIMDGGTLSCERRQRRDPAGAYNEVIASRIMEKLGIPHVEYMLQIRDGLPYSVCRDFITPKNGIHSGLVSDAYKSEAESCLVVSALSGTVWEALGDPRRGTNAEPADRAGLHHCQRGQASGQFWSRADAETLEFISPRRF